MDWGRTEQESRGETRVKSRGVNYKKVSELRANARIVENGAV